MANWGDRIIDALLCYCRQGFEPELAGELPERAAQAGIAGYARTERDSGHVLFFCEDAEALDRALPFSQLIFARQKLRLIVELSGLDPSDRISPLLAALEGAPRFGELVMEHPDTEAGKPLAGLAPQRRSSRLGEHWSAGSIEIVQGDAFGLTPADLAGIAGVYDRGAMVALPPELRRRYVDTVYAGLPAGCRGLLLTLEYPQHEMDGPPFDVAESEVRQALAGWRPELLERRDLLAVEPRYRERGLSAMHTAAYRLLHGPDGR